MYFIYAIYNSKYNKIYIGQTIDLEQRLRLHNEKEFKDSYTSRFDGKWELVYAEKAIDRKSALKREKELKSYQGRQFIKRHIPQ